jgi:hypothetical protein
MVTKISLQKLLCFEFLDLSTAFVGGKRYPQSYPQFQDVDLVESKVKTRI